MIQKYADPVTGVTAPSGAVRHGCISALRLAYQDLYGPIARIQQVNLLSAVRKGDVVDQTTIQQQHLSNPTSSWQQDWTGRSRCNNGGFRRGGRLGEGTRMIRVGGALHHLISNEAEAGEQQDGAHDQDGLEQLHGVGCSDAVQSRGAVAVSLAESPAVVEEDDLPDETLPDGAVCDPATAAGGEASLHPLTVTAEMAGERLDRVLALALAGTGLTRTRLKALIEDRAFRLDGAVVTDASRLVRAGQTGLLTVPAAVPARPQAQDIPLHIVYEDASLLVLDKPAGMVVHPAAGNADGTLVNALLHHCRGELSGIGGVSRPGIVHRLDKDTSGLMVVAKNDRAHSGLSAQFADRSLSRTYQALVWGLPSPASGTVDAPIGRHPVDRKRMAVVTGGGKPAITGYRTLACYGMAVALIECSLQTGRTHQIRVHMEKLGHPLVGDPLYGKVRPGRLRPLPDAVRQDLQRFPRQALHAVAIRFRHPLNGDLLRFESPLPDDFLHLRNRLETL
jgi:23S rRNA pseudouridine1911/1915/1917 synthase